jgi:hypothetical protein
LKKKRKMKSDTTLQKKARRIKKPDAVEGGRMSNYSEHEDYFKAVAYMSPLIQSEELDRREKTFGCKSMINFACCNKKSWLNLANTFKYEPRIQLNRGGRRGLPKVCSYGISTTNN